jgi:hypothetical protein
MLPRKLTAKMDGTESPLRSTDAKSTRRTPSCTLTGAGLAALAAAQERIRGLRKTLNLKLIPYQCEWL